MAITPEQLASSNTEHGHQAALFCWAAQNYDKHLELAFMFAIPNGGQRHAAVASKLKAEGVKSGVPDIFLPIPRKHWHGLFIELKIGKNEPSEAQHKWLAALDRKGYRAVWCIGWEQARDIILEYLK
jgi:hypothetical protein